MLIIENLYKLSLNILIIFSVVFFIYSLITISKLSKSQTVRLPKFYNYLYLKFTSIPILNGFLEYLQKGFYLIYVNKDKSKVMATTLLALFPSLFILVFTFMNTFSYVWYLTLLNFVLCLLFPVYFIKNFTGKKCLEIRKSMINSFASLVTLLGHNRMSVAIDELIKSSSGSRKEIFCLFRDKYSADKLEAYDFLVDIMGDRYTDSIVKYLIKYEEFGIDPTSDVMDICNDAQQMYMLESMSKKNLNSIKIMSVWALGFNIFIGWFGKTLVGNMGGTYDSFTLYLSAFMCFAIFIICFILESN